MMPLTCDSNCTRCRFSSLMSWTTWTSFWCALWTIFSAWCSAWVRTKSASFFALALISLDFGFPEPAESRFEPLLPDVEGGDFHSAQYTRRTGEAPLGRNFAPCAEATTTVVAYATCFPGGKPMKGMQAETPQTAAAPLAVECTHCGVAMSERSGVASQVRYFRCPSCGRWFSSMYAEIFRSDAKIRVLGGRPAALKD